MTALVSHSHSVSETRKIPACKSIVYSMRALDVLNHWQTHCSKLALPKEQEQEQVDIFEYEPQ
jgi:hypothetical protein